MYFERSFVMSLLIANKSKGGLEETIWSRHIENVLLLQIELTEFINVSCNMHKYGKVVLLVCILPCNPCLCCSLTSNRKEDQNCSGNVLFVHC